MSLILILNNFNKLEPMSIIFANRTSRIFFLQITIIFSYWTSCVLTLPCNIWQSCSTERDQQSHQSEAKPGCIRVQAIILNICYRRLMTSKVI